MGKGVYHVQDPVENLKIRINLREVSGSHSLSSSSHKKREPFDQIIEFSWQEKVYGPRDISDFLLHKKSSFGRQTQLESRRNLSNLERNGVNVQEDLLSEVMIYSYCNDEPFYPALRNIVGNGGKSEQNQSYLSYALEPSTGGNEDARQERASERIIRENDEAKYMQICLATGVKKGANAAAIVNDMTEVVLCSVKLMKNGLMIVSPGFSHVITEDSQVLHYATEGDNNPSASTSSLFMDNATISAGLKKGFRLSTHRIRTAAGEEFEYAIENVNGVLSPIEIEELMAAEQRKDFAFSEQSRGSSRKKLEANDPDELNKWNHSSIPDSFNQMTSIYAEIESAVGFNDDDPIYVRYQLLLPEDKSKCLLRSNTESSCGSRGFEDDVKSPQKTEQAHNPLHTSSKESREEINCFSDHKKKDMLVDAVGYTQVSAVDKRASGAGLSLGAFVMISSALAVYYGPSYPFWLVPALAFLLCLVFGPLPTNSQVNVIRGCAHSQAYDNMNYTTCTGHPGKTRKDSEVVGRAIAESKTTFGHPIHFDIYLQSTDEEAALSSSKSSAPSSSHATMLFEVFSVNAYKRHVLEGCGYTHIPLGARGSRKETVEISTWKPIGDHKSRLVDTYLGGGCHLTNARFIEVPNKAASAISKFGTRTESSGVIKFHYKRIIYVPQELRALPRHTLSNGQLGRVPSTPSVGGRTASGVPKRTVEDILNAYKNTDLLSRSINRATLRSGQSTPNNRSVSLWGDDDTGKYQEGVLSVDKVAEIVARARANTEQLQKEGEGVSHSSTFTKPRSPPQPRRGEAEEGRREYSVLSSDEEDSRASDQGSDSDISGSGLTDRFEAADIMRGRNKKKRSKRAEVAEVKSKTFGGRTGNSGISMGKPLNPLSLTGARSELQKVFGSDSDGDEESAGLLDGRSGSKKPPERAMGRPALSPMHKRK